MARIYAKGVIADDTWRPLHDGEVAARGDLVFAPITRWLALSLADQSRTGVTFAAHEAGESDLARLARAPLVVITLPAFTDGRAYSVARTLRERHHYTGDLRAAGDVLLDQIPLLERCGFTSFAITHGPTLDALSRGHIPAIATTYQRATLARYLSIRPTLQTVHEEPSA